MPPVANRALLILFISILAPRLVHALGDGGQSTSSGRDWIKVRPRVVEEKNHLWALVQYESLYGRIHFKSFLAFGDFHDCNLRGLRADGFRLNGFNFSKADLRGADFRGADLTGVNFRGSDLREAVFATAADHGVSYDSDTQLPFSAEEAARRGWIKVHR